MGHVVVAAVGNCSAEVGDLQWREVDFALPDGDTDDCQAVPRTLVGLVIELGIGYKPPLFAIKIDAEFITKPHADHIVAPSIHSNVHVRIFPSVAHHVIESPTEIGIARGTDSFD